MRLQIRNHGATLSLLTDRGDIVTDLQGITLAATEDGVQLLLHLEADGIDIDSDETTDISGTIDALLAQLDKED